MKRQMPWYGWVGVVLVALAAVTAAVEQSVTLRGVVIAAAGAILWAVGFALRRPAPPAREPVVLPRP